jgi:heme-degrading monooxygenase HmoA
MSARIDPTARLMTLVNVFTVTADRQQELVELLDEATQKIMKHQPGFISANIHKSSDGTRVVNYAQWRSKAEFEAMQKNPEAAVHMRAVAALAKFDPIVCEVTSSHSNAPAR